MHAGIRALVEDAVAAGELVPCRASEVARAIQATLNGSLLNWAIHRQGSVTAWIRRDVRTVLERYRRGRRERS
jgi:hypothetical protein